LPTVIGRPVISAQSGFSKQISVLVRFAELKEPRGDAGLFREAKNTRAVTALDELEARTIEIVREAYFRLTPLCMLWSVGKDSTALLWMVRKAFLGSVPFPVVLLDTGMELDEVYAFRDEIALRWNLDARNEPCPSEDSIDPSLPPAARAAARKTAGLKALIGRQRYRGVIVGIRRDEQAIRAKERVFSRRDGAGAWDPQQQGAEVWGLFETGLAEGQHFRVHPLLHWSELDIWRYIKRESIPFVPLYLAKDGLRYRSLGEKNITFPIASDAASLDEIIAELEGARTSERAGRSMDFESEDAFERLRTTGYM